MTAAQHIQDKGIRRISSLLDAWWKIVLIIGSILGFLYYSIIAWVNVQAAIKQGQINKDDIQFIKEHYATQESIKAVDEKVNKQYQTNGAINERVNGIDRQLEYQHGFRDGVIQEKSQEHKTP